MKNLLKVKFLVIFFLFVLINSCRHIVIVDSRAVIVSRSIDLTLNDSALIYGTVFFGEDEKVTMSNAKIWIEGGNIKTNSDDLGFFSIKISPGIYTVKCLGEQYEEKFTAILNNLSVSSNEKAEITFFHGYIAE